MSAHTKSKRLTEYILFLSNIIMIYDTTIVYDSLKERNINMEKSREEQESFEKSKIMEMIRDIKDGKLTIQWQYWFFAAGRDYGDEHLFKVFQDGKEFDLFRIDGNTDGLRLRLNNLPAISYGDSCEISISDEEFSEIYDTIWQAAVRDDLELKEKLMVDGQLHIPQDYGDIDRKDILTGRWSAVSGWADEEE